MLTRENTAVSQVCTLNTSMFSLTLCQAKIGKFSVPLPGQCVRKVAQQPHGSGSSSVVTSDGAWD